MHFLAILLHFYAFCGFSCILSSFYLHFCAALVKTFKGICKVDREDILSTRISNHLALFFRKKRSKWELGTKSNFVQSFCYKSLPMMKPFLHTICDIVQLERWTLVFYFTNRLSRINGGVFGGYWVKHCKKRFSSVLMFQIRSRIRAGKKFGVNGRKQKCLTVTTTGSSVLGFLSQILDQSKK